ncbi:MAG: AAA family ATPase [Gammaproteobacteria bacterium]|nr:AAA family ATPase [Gammaproteobacteria bacterium]
MRFCGQCATALERLCPQCAFSNPSNFGFCGQCGHALDSATQANTPPSPSNHPKQQDAERRQLTVLFCDIVGSSALSARIDPEELRDVMREYRATCSEVVVRYDGYVAQYLGDGVLVYFGYPSAHEDDASRAVRAALELTERIPQLSFPVQGGDDVRIAVRVGVHTGLVVIGEIGGGDKRTLALGEAPNIAARIQDCAATNTVVVSAATRKLLAAPFPCDSLGSPSLKGFSKPLELFCVCPLRGNPQVGFRTISQVPLVGRSQETDLLLERLDQARKGVGQVVLLSGEPGLGKTRMVQLLCDKVAEENCLLLECAGTPYYQNSFLFPVIELTRRLMGLDDITDTREALTSIEQMVATLSMEADTAVPVLAGLLSLPLGDRYPPVAASTPQQKKQQAMDVLVAILQNLAQQKFVLLVVEDLQWVDASTLELLGQLERQPGLSNLFALFTFRNEFTPPWPTRANLTRVTLNRLTRHQSGSLVRQLCHGKTLPLEVFNEIINQTDGIPFFVEELTNTVLRSELLEEHGDHYALNMPMSQLGIPTTLQDSLMCRLDGLGEDKELAQLSATLGREFDHGLLSAISDRNEDQLRQGLNHLINAELFFQRGTPPRAWYRFRHALLREAAYQSLLKRTRQKYHQRIAALLKGDFQHLIADNPELLAHHCTEAGDYAEAVKYWLAAGRHAIQRSANIEAVAHLNSGLSVLERLPNSPQRRTHELALQTTLGLAAIMSKGYAAPEVEQAYARARELCRNMDDTNAVFPILCGLWEFYVVRARLSTASALAQELKTMAEHSRTPGLVLEAQRVVGTTQFWQGQFVSALEQLEPQDAHPSASSHTARSSALAPYCQDSQVATLANAASVHWLLGHPDRALDSAHEALKLAKRLSHPFSQAYALHFLGTVLQLRGDRENTGKYAEALIVLCETYGFAFWTATGKMLRAWAQHDNDCPDITCTLFEQALEHYQASGNQLARSYFIALLAGLYLQAGRLDSARHIIDNALEETAITGEGFFTAELLRIQGELYRESPPDYPHADTLLSRSLQQACEQKAHGLSLRSATSLARCRAQQCQNNAQPQYPLEHTQALLRNHLAAITEGQATKDILDARELLASFNNTGVTP